MCWCRDSSKWSKSTYYSEPVKVFWARGQRQITQLWKVICSNFTIPQPFSLFNPVSSFPPSSASKSKDAFDIVLLTETETLHWMVPQAIISKSVCTLQKFPQDLQYLQNFLPYKILTDGCTGPPMEEKEWPASRHNLSGKAYQMFKYEIMYQMELCVLLNFGSVFGGCCDMKGR